MPVTIQESNSWLNWTPTTRILDESLNSEPTKPTLPTVVPHSFANPTEVDPQNLRNRAAGEMADGTNGSVEDVRRANALMNRIGIRIVHLPLGEQALEYPWDANLDDVRWAMTVLGMEAMPLVIGDDGWMTWNQWRLRPGFWAEARRDQAAREQAKSAAMEQSPPVECDISPKPEEVTGYLWEDDVYDESEPNSSPTEPDPNYVESSVRSH